MIELSLHILDIAQNSIRAKAKQLTIKIEEQLQNNWFRIEITDNGSGMSNEQIEKVTDPFFTTRTTRKVGLGIPLLKHTAEQTGGKFEIQSEPGKGTSLKISLGLKHIDRPILGDIAGTLIILANNEIDTDIKYIHQTEKGIYIFDTAEIKQTLDDVPLSNPEIQHYLKEMIKENLEQIQISE